jgi:ornithine cyclodeaminase
MPRPAPRLLYLRRDDVIRLMGESCKPYIEPVRRALVLHARGMTVQPLKPYLRRNHGPRHVADRIIAMPALLEDQPAVAGIKWIASKHDNPTARGLERASGLIVLNDCETNYPIALLEAGLISGMRTAAITVIAARHLARDHPRRIACVGCGFIGRLQVRGLVEELTELTEIALFDLEARASTALARELESSFPGVVASVAASAEECVAGADVVVASTVTDQPYLRFAWLARGAFLSNVSLVDACDDVFLRANKVVVDDWEQCAREGKPLQRLAECGLFARDRVHAELGQIVAGDRPGRESDDEVIVLNPMGLAIEDIGAAHAVYERAVEQGAGQWLDLY